MKPAKPATPTAVQRLPIGMHCAQCHAAVDIDPRVLLTAFIARAPLNCPRCHEPYDVWARMVERLKFGVFGMRWAAIGADVVTAQIVLERDQPLTLEFKSFGIAETALIEEIALTPTGGADGFLAPVFHTDPKPGQAAAEAPLIYPIPVGTGAEQNSVGVLIVSTSEMEGRQPAREALFAGIRAAGRGDHSAAVISCNVGMELALDSVMHRWLERHRVGRDRRTRFLESQATYGAQLNVLLPVAAATQGIPELPEAARAALGRLRSLRNDVAHRDRQAVTITGDDVARSIAGAAVGLVYCDALLATLT